MTESGFANITPEMFENGPLRVFGKTINHYVATVTDLESGKKSISYANAVQITCILHPNENIRDREKTGHWEENPGFYAALPSTGIKVDDKLEDPDTSKIYLVRTFVNRRGVFIYGEVIYLEGGT